MTDVQALRKNKLCILYNAAYIKELKKAIQEGAEKHSNIMQLVFYGVKMVNTLPKAEGKARTESRFASIIGVKNSMKLLTLSEFMNIFPIEKKYNGHKFEMKDYYSTVQAIKELNIQPNEIIGERIDELLMGYMNRELLRFMVNEMCVISALRRFDGHLHPFEEFMASQGMETQNTFKNTKGETMYVRHGKPEKIKVSNSKNSHLQLVN